MKIYKQRRDLFCKLLKEELDNFFQFKIPQGGLAVWVKLNSSYSWKSLSEIARKHKLEIGEWQCYDNAKLNHNCIRIGFAAYNEKEIYELINSLKKTRDEVKNLENFS